MSYVLSFVAAAAVGILVFRRDPFLGIFLGIFVLTLSLLTFARKPAPRGRSRTTRSLFQRPRHPAGQEPIQDGAFEEVKHREAE